MKGRERVRQESGCRWGSFVRVGRGAGVKAGEGSSSSRKSSYSGSSGLTGEESPAELRWVVDMPVILMARVKYTQVGPEGQVHGAGTGELR